jgi:hypothetical protein
MRFRVRRAKIDADARMKYEAAGAQVIALALGLGSINRNAVATSYIVQMIVLQPAPAPGLPSHCAKAAREAWRPKAEKAWADYCAKPAHP